jgi:PAS domain S-box-containing protein
MQANPSNTHAKAIAQMTSENKKGNEKHPLQEFVRKFNELSSVFESMPTGVFAILDQNMNIATINKAAYKILRTDTDSIMGKNARDILETNFPGIQKLVQETIVNRRPIKNFNLEIEDQYGEIKTYLVSTAITEESLKEDFGVVLVLHDISEVTRLRKVFLSEQSFGALIGSSPGMKELYGIIETIAEFDTTVLIYGETGTGKELVARTIHNLSHRKNGPFIPINCSALISSVLESELFGHVKGAFTGAIQDRRGRFEMAKGGTVFLDEIGTLSLDLQVKLLRTIQERIIERVGSSEQIPIDVRVISATNHDLTELIAKKLFREDLYYRLKVFQINVPALRSRRLDIPILGDHFIEKFNRVHGKKTIGLSNASKELIMKYSWPGNVRELENAIEHAMILSPGKIIEPQHFPPEIRHMQKDGMPPAPSISKDPNSEEENIRRALSAFRGNVTKAANQLGMHRSTLWRKMREYGIKRIRE